MTTTTVETISGKLHPRALFRLSDDEDEEWDDDEEDEDWEDDEEDWDDEDDDDEE